jgi:hypothetical protein
MEAGWKDMQNAINDSKMTEAEVSLRVAIYFIYQKLICNSVSVSLDGAQIKTAETIHFDIFGFLNNIGAKKTIGESGKWQGTYRLPDTDCTIQIHSQPGVGDVAAKLADGSFLVVESKKGALSKSKAGTEYQLIREAIGQLMTNSILTENKKLAVAIPHNEKSLELAKRWSEFPQIKQVGIKFFLVNRSDDLIVI